MTPLKPSGDITISHDNPHVSIQGYFLRVPCRLAETYAVIITNTEYILIDTTTGEEIIGVPLPVTTPEIHRHIPLWKVPGARIRNPRPF